MSILDEIFTHKRNEVAAAKRQVPGSELQKLARATPIPPDFAQAITDMEKPAPRLIAEVKHRSPSKGVLCQNFDPLRLAKIYANNGAVAISVLTDEKYFGGKLAYLQDIFTFLRDPKGSKNREFHPPTSRKKPLGSSIPLLRKDFIFDRYQLLEARTAGASAVLLIAAMLDQPNLRALISEANDLSLTPLIEVHTRTELNRALEANARVIGINNRDLHTFEVRLQTTLDLRSLVPAGIIVVAESGIKTMDDVVRLADAGVDAMLIGEGLVKAENIAEKARAFSQISG